MLRQNAECFFWYRPTRVVPEQMVVVVVVVVKGITVFSGITNKVLASNL